ncbi:hypothetical protein NDN08_005442 [Rhodosorus marinus]|uniref:Cupin 2 conserved barrel domain-containing protein n=1 Tax=Rhodosorus marinus TaxID=101924 RepID=A0AAV8V4I8_9RHOD|nr:hypothetical protein NDN08_005442 [Rhodosorus marinus]
MAWVTAIVSAVCSSLLTVLSLRAYGASCERDRTKPRAEKEQILSAARSKVNGLQYGNAALEGKERGGWFAGHFVNAENLLKTDRVEVKWAELTIGTNDKHATLNIKSDTLCILISGTFLVDFGKQKVLLERRGDYVFWIPEVAHAWSAVSDAVILTIRWPSLPHDQRLLSDPQSAGFAL